MLPRCCCTCRPRRPHRDALPLLHAQDGAGLGVESLLDIDAGIDIWNAEPGGAVEMALAVTVPVTSLCPCSKEISDYGAHNQRSHLSLRVQLREDMSVEELVRIAEEEASCEVFGLLKRPDEKWVTERAYDNPKFVEDLVRDIALRLRAEPRIGLVGGFGEFRVDPQPLGLCADRGKKCLT
jgi:GTP cyclohydrolase I